MTLTRTIRSPARPEVGTFARLRRAATPFAIVKSRSRKLASAGPGESRVRSLALGPWEEGTRGDPLHKLVFVVAGQIDVEGPHGGWLVPRNHMIFIPLGRDFNLRAARGTRLLVVHMDAPDCPWPRPGCWVSAADDSARVMLHYPLRWTETRRDSEVARLFLKTLSSVCVDWFENRRMLHVPAAGTAPMRRVLGYLEQHLADANLAGACARSGLTPRTLQRRCEEEIAMSWRELVREVRMMRAVELLLQQRHSVGRIAAEVGFRSMGAFATAFTARHGMSPTAFARAFAPAPNEGEP